MDKARTKELDGFETIFKKHYPNLVSYSYRILQNYSEAEDVVQDVFFSYWKKAGSFKLISSPESYLYGAVKHQCQNKIRHSIVVHNFESKVSTRDNLADDPHSKLVGIETEELIKKILNGLPERTRKIFVMNRFESKKYREIADELSISLKTVEAHMGKVLKVLKLNLNHHMYMILFLLFGQ